MTDKLIKNIGKAGRSYASDSHGRKPKVLSDDQRRRLHRIHLQGAYVRSGGMFLILFFSWVAFRCGILGFNAFVGASLSIICVLLIHIPIIPLLKNVSRKKVHELLSFLLNFLEIICYTGFLYFIGGFRSAHLTPIYAVVIFYVGVLSPRRFPYILAVFSSLAFASTTVLEHFGVIPHQEMVFEYDYELNVILIVLLFQSILLLAVAYISAYVGGILSKSGIRLREQNKELELTNARLKEEIEERGKTYEALRASEEKLHDIFENVPDALYAHDLEGRFLETNLGMKRILGYEDDEFLPENLGVRDLSPERYQTDVDAFLRDATKKDKSEGIIRVLTRHGQERLLEYKNSLIRDSMGNAVGVRGSARDVTEKIQAGKERLRLQEQLQQAKKMEALGTLAGGVAHDLNNILSGIVSYPELLLMDLPRESPLYKPLITIQRSGEKAASIVQDLLTLARRGVSVSEFIDLNSCIREYLKSPEFQKLISAHPRIEVKNDLEESLFRIAGSPVHMMKTVMNLVTNAAESMPDGGEIMIASANASLQTPLKGFDTFKKGEYVILSISDTGVGMSDKERERIFDPFYTKKVMGRSGTGLGLTVVWGTVKDMGGHIDVESSAGKGSKFILYFPAMATNDVLKKNLSGEDYSGNGERVLVVDDSAEQHEIAESMLTKLGYTVTSVVSGEMAVEYLADHQVDLVLLDMIMPPGIDGLETYRRIIKMHPGQKAVIASGYSETDRVREAQRLGAGAYIRKPYHIEKLGLAVKRELMR